MGRLHRIKTHLVATLLVTLVLTLVVLVILRGYLFHWDWAGFNGKIKSGKTLWDWMQLLFIPVVLAVAGFWFNHRERKAAELRAEAEREIERQRAKTESDIAEDNQRETALQEYIDKMSELLLHEKLRESKPEDEVRTIARVLTLTVIRRCDAERKGSVLLFLHESGLIGKDKRIFHLTGADLNRANLWRADLSGADLSGVYLSDASLGKAKLFGANLSKAKLFGASLILANLRGALVTPEQLTTTKSLKGTTMPDGSVHP